uniref:Uncharacterized protein n=1 Tax=Knipowitschia caucasica TaxID=637954 RepID=A0AAV2LIG7_KNICA
MQWSFLLLCACVSLASSPPSVPRSLLSIRYKPVGLGSFKSGLAVSEPFEVNCSAETISPHHHASGTTSFLLQNQKTSQNSPHNLPPELCAPRLPLGAPRQSVPTDAGSRTHLDMQPAAQSPHTRADRQVWDVAMQKF